MGYADRNPLQEHLYTEFQFHVKFQGISKMRKIQVPGEGFKPHTPPIHSGGLEMMPEHSLSELSDLQFFGFSSVKSYIARFAYFSVS